MIRFVNILTTIALLSLLASCDRAFVEPLPPQISVISPDLSQVFQNPDISVEIEASSFREISRVRIDGIDLTFDDLSATWKTERRLLHGSNKLVVEVTDAADISATDTLLAVYLPLEIQSCLVDGEQMRLGGQEGTRLEDGSVLFTGGAESVTTPSGRSAYILSPDGSTLLKPIEQPRYARTGHSALLLPDGRVLLVAGSTLDPNEAASDGIGGLSGGVEIFYPETESFAVIPVEAPNPIRRTGGTGIIFDLPVAGGRETAVYLFGGRGDVRYGSNPAWGIRDDLRSFVLENDTLFSVGPPFGDPVEAMSEHTLTPLSVEPKTGLGRYLFAGSYLSGAPGTEDTAVFDLNFSLETPLTRIDGDVFFQPRSSHAAVRLDSELVLFIGGKGGNGVPTGSMELFSAFNRRMLRVPVVISLENPRYRHNATMLPDGRILVTGGFDRAGQALGSAECILVRTPEESANGKAGRI